MSYSNEFLDKDVPYPRDKHATISVLTFRKKELSEQENYLFDVENRFQVVWFKKPNGTFQEAV